MPRITLKELQTLVASYVDAQKQAGTYSSSSDNLAGLVDKIAKSITIDGIYADKLPELDGEELPLGKTIEEFFEDLVPVQDYNDYKSSDSDAAQNALKPYYPSYEDPSYNYTIGRKKIPTTLKFNEYERAMNSAEELAVITNLVLKRLYDSFGQFKYDCKKQIVANAIAKAEALQADTGATQYKDYSVAHTNVAKGTRYYYTDSSSVKHYAMCVKAKTAASGDTYATLINGGYLVEYDLLETLAIPTDTSTGEAFIKSVKNAAENAQFVSEGHSLNPSTIGATEGLLLIIKKGILNVLDVDTYAGAFNPDNLAIPATIKVVDDFGNNNTGAYAMLVDSRALRLHPTYMAVREQPNGEGDYVNYFLHTENTAFISKNCFMHIWKNA